MRSLYKDPAPDKAVRLCRVPGLSYEEKPAKLLLPGRPFPFPTAKSGDRRPVAPSALRRLSCRGRCDGADHTTARQNAMRRDDRMRPAKIKRSLYRSTATFLVRLTGFEPAAFRGGRWHCGKRIAQKGRMFFQTHLRDQLSKAMQAPCCSGRAARQHRKSVWFGI